MDAVAACKRQRAGKRGKLPVADSQREYHGDRPRMVASEQVREPHPADIPDIFGNEKQGY